MALVAYPDSASDDGEDTDTGHDNIRVEPTKPSSGGATDALALPPLPPAFHDLYATNARVSTSDNPDLHGGRRRAVPHVQGNWPSHVYLECKDTHEHAITSSIHGRPTDLLEGYRHSLNLMPCMA